MASRSEIISSLIEIIEAQDKTKSPELKAKQLRLLRILAALADDSSTPPAHLTLSEANGRKPP